MKVKFHGLEAFSYNGTELSRAFGLPGSIRDFIKRFPFFCQGIWLGHPPSPGSTCVCLCLGQVSTPSSYQLYRVSVTWQGMVPFFSKKRNVSAEHFETTCSIQGWVSDEFEKKFHRIICCLPKYQAIAFSFSAFSMETICGFQVYWVFLILLIAKKGNKILKGLKTDTMLFACMIK